MDFSTTSDLLEAVAVGSKKEESVNREKNLMVVVLFELHYCSMLLRPNKVLGQGCWLLTVESCFYRSGVEAALCNVNTIRLAYTCGCLEEHSVSLGCHFAFLLTKLCRIQLNDLIRVKDINLRLTNVTIGIFGLTRPKFHPIQVSNYGDRINAGYRDSGHSCGN